MSARRLFVLALALLAVSLLAGFLGAVVLVALTHAHAVQQPPFP